MLFIRSYYSFYFCILYRLQPQRHKAVMQFIAFLYPRYCSNDLRVQPRVDH